MGSINKAVLVLGLVLFALGICVGGITAKEPPGTSIFEGITPCTNVDSPVPHIAPDAACELMIWHLTLNQDPETGHPTTYTLHSTYGMSQPNTTGVGKGRTELDLEGKWTILRGTAHDPEALVYQLNPDTPEQAISFIRLSDYLLHVLSQERNLMVGHGAWSYTLNRTDAKLMVDPTISSREFTFEDATLADAPRDSTTLGVFEGRTPCADLVYDFTGFSRDPACAKIKWQLTLHRNLETGEPSTYEFKGVQPTTDKIGEITGTWKALRSPQIHGDAIVYQLSPDESDVFLFFLRIDENHLFLLDHELNFMVGDALWSYTLSRTG